MEMTPQIWLSVGFMAFYLILQLYDDFTRLSHKTNTRSRILESLRTEYKVPIRTFAIYKAWGFTSFRSIWINEKVLRSEKNTRHVFYHEYYHLKHKHKQYNLLARFVVAITPLSMYFVHWGIWLAILLISAYITHYLKEKVFEVNAEEYAKKMNR